VADPRVEAVEAYVYSIRSGEPSAAARAAACLATRRRPIGWP
jgi:hypothetical protein